MAQEGHRSRPAIAVPTPGFIYNLGKRLKQLYAGSTDPRDQGLLNLTWDYDFDEQPRLPDGTLSRIEGEPDLEKVLMEINGHRLDETDPRTGGLVWSAATRS